ncbi:MAG: hypothetical protein AAGK04_04955 [Planctomycetota bacterium]
MNLGKRGRYACGLLWLWIASCAAPPEIASPAQNTPYQHNAAKVFYLGDPTGAAAPGVAYPSEIEDEFRWDRYRALLSDAELADRIRAERGAVRELAAVGSSGPALGLRAETEPTLRDLIRLQENARQSVETMHDGSAARMLDDVGIHPSDLDRVIRFGKGLSIPDPTMTQIASAYERELVRHGDPLGVIVSGVRLPASLGGRRDVAVLLRAHSSNDLESPEIVVAYQRDYQPGTMLNFADLLVYFDPQWDSSNPVEFRLRVLDVRAERNTRVRELLDRSQKVIASISGLVPHPVIPGVDVAIEAARQILGNRENEILLDYLVQFHALATFEGANQADLGLLRRGSWMVVGRRSMGTDVEWAYPVYRDRRTDELIYGPLSPDMVYQGERAQAPFFEVIVTTADVQVPRGVMDRSQQLLNLISTNGKDDPDALVSSVNALRSAVLGYTAERRLKRHRTLADLGNAIDALFRAQPAVDPSSALATDQKRSLERVIRLVLGVDVYARATSDHQRPPQAYENSGIDPQLDSLRRWWDAVGRRGSIQKDVGSALGFVWMP